MDHRDWGGGGLRSGGSLQEGSLFRARWSGMSSLEEVTLERSQERWVAVRQVEGWGVRWAARWRELCGQSPV